MSHLFVLPTTEDAQSSSSPTSSAELILSHEMKACPPQQGAPASVSSYLQAPSLTKYPHPDDYDYFDDVNHRLSRPTAYNQNNDDADSTAAPPSAPTRDALRGGRGVGIVGGGAGVFNPYPRYQQRQDHCQGRGHGYGSYLFNNASYPMSSPPPGLVAAWSSPDNSSRTSTSRS